MATSDVEFLFCCPCFVSVVHDSMFQRHRFNYQYINFYNQAITVKNLVIETFAVCKSTLVVYFAHLSEVMFHDCLVCVRYNRKTFYRLLIESERFPRYKCYSCYRRSVKKLLKYFVLFLVSPDHEK